MSVEHTDAGPATLRGSRSDTLRWYPWRATIENTAHPASPQVPGPRRPPYARCNCAIGVHDPVLRLALCELAILGIVTPDCLRRTSLPGAPEFVHIPVPSTLISNLRPGRISVVWQCPRA